MEGTFNSQRHLAVDKIFDLEEEVELSPIEQKLRQAANLILQPIPDYNQGIRILQQAQFLDPSNLEVKSLLDECKRKLHKRIELSKSFSHKDKKELGPKANDQSNLYNMALDIDPTIELSQQWFDLHRKKEIENQLLIKQVASVAPSSTHGIAFSKVPSSTHGIAFSKAPIGKRVRVGVENIINSEPKSIEIGNQIQIDLAKKDFFSIRNHLSNIITNQEDLKRLGLTAKTAEIMLTRWNRYLMDLKFVGQHLKEEFEKEKIKQSTPLIKNLQGKIQLIVNELTRLAKQLLDSD